MPYTMEPLTDLVHAVQKRFSKTPELPFDQQNYVTFAVSRGLNYHYYRLAPGQEEESSKTKPWLLFLHGFPSTSYDWGHQIAFFRTLGYGLIVPDLLGYGGTDKPTTPEFYLPSLMCKDIIDIFDHEGIEKAIVIGHDMGGKLASRLANYYPERFTAFAFLAQTYVPPTPTFDLHAMMAGSKAALGYEAYGYWFFLGEEGSDKMIEHDFDAFFSIAWPADPEVWQTDLGALGGLKAWLLANKRAPLPKYLTEEDKNIMKTLLLRGGFLGPVNWYRVMTTHLEAEDDAKIPSERYRITQPVFFGGATQDRICTFELNKEATMRSCANVTIREFDADHWLMLSHAADVSRELALWIRGIEAGAPEPPPYADSNAVPEAAAE